MRFAYLDFFFYVFLKCIALKTAAAEFRVTMTDPAPGFITSIHKVQTDHPASAGKSTH